MNNQKRRFIAFSLAFVLTTTIINEKLKNKSSNIYFDESIDNPYYIGTCDTGNVYFASKEEMKYLRASNVDGILIIDDRADADPNIRILDSHKIKSTQAMKDVLNIVKQYDDKNPSKWSRTMKSMINEWWIHNVCYAYNYYAGNAGDVDLNNDDEELFNGFDFKKLILKKQKLDK